MRVSAISAGDCCEFSAHDQRPIARQRIRLLVLKGELDRATTPSLAATLNSAWSRHGAGVIVDLTGVTSVDSTGIGLLHHSQLRFAGAGRCLAVVSDDVCDPKMVTATRSGPTLDVFHSPQMRWQR